MIVKRLLNIRCVCLLLMLFLVLPVGSGVVDVCDCCSISTQGGGLMVCPQGDGLSLIDVGAEIHIIVRDDSGRPIEGIGETDFWLVGTGDEMYLCGGSGSSNADAPTNAAGYTTMSGTIAAGGWSDGLYLVIQGNVIGCPPFVVAVNVRSPDINGDLSVNLADFSIFASSFPSPPNAYDHRCDYNYDGSINLVDHSMFGQHFNHNCQQ